jgi:hypothetical protein
VNLHIVSRIPIAMHLPASQPDGFAEPLHQSARDREFDALVKQFTRVVSLDLLGKAVDGPLFPQSETGMRLLLTAAVNAVDTGRVQTWKSEIVAELTEDLQTCHDPQRLLDEGLTLFVHKLMGAR